MGEMADYYYDRMYDEDLEFEDLFERNIWVTKDFEEIHLKEMIMTHIQNSIKYIERGGEVFGFEERWLPKLKQELEERI